MIFSSGYGWCGTSRSHFRDYLVELQHMRRWWTVLRRAGGMGRSVGCATICGERMGLTAGAKRNFGEFLHDWAGAERQAAVL